MLVVTSAQGCSHLVKLQTNNSHIGVPEERVGAQGGSGSNGSFCSISCQQEWEAPPFFPCFWSSPDSFILLYLVPAVSEFCAFKFLLFLVPHLESLYHFPLFIVLGNQTHSHTHVKQCSTTDIYPQSSYCY